MEKSCILEDRKETLFIIFYSLLYLYNSFSIYGFFSLFFYPTSHKGAGRECGIHSCSSTFNEIVEKMRTREKFIRTRKVSLLAIPFGSYDVHPHFHFKQRIKIFVLNILPVLEVMLRCSRFSRNMLITNLFFRTPSSFHAELTQVAAMKMMMMMFI